MTRSQSIAIAKLAKEFVHSHDCRQIARRERNKIQCLEESSGDESDGYYVVPPCWKSEEPKTYCDQCKERAKIHEVAKMWTGARTAALRRLRAAVNKTIPV